LLQKLCSLIHAKALRFLLTENRSAVFASVKLQQSADHVSQVLLGGNHRVHAFGANPLQQVQEHRGHHPDQVAATTTTGLMLYKVGKLTTGIQ